MKGNTDKCHLLLSKDESFEIHIGDYIIKRSTCEKLLGINTDLKLRFDDHIQVSCNTSNRKWWALAWETPYTNLQKRKVLMNDFFNTQFNYCTLIWMLQSSEIFQIKHGQFLEIVSNIFAQTTRHYNFHKIKILGYALWNQFIMVLKVFPA